MTTTGSGGSQTRSSASAVRHSPFPSTRPPPLLCGQQLTVTRPHPDLFPWHVPPLPVLSGYARKATEQLLDGVPLLHGPSTVLSELPTHTAFALTVAGGAYEPEGQSFSNEMLVEKRVFLVRGASSLLGAAVETFELILTSSRDAGFQEEQKSWDEKFSSLQSLLLYQLLGLFHRDEQRAFICLLSRSINRHTSDDLARVRQNASFRSRSTRHSCTCCARSTSPARSARRSLSCLRPTCKARSSTRRGRRGSSSRLTEGACFWLPHSPARDTRD